MLAQAKDASVIHNVMLHAFNFFQRVSKHPLKTIESIEQAMENGEHAFIGYIDEQPVAMVRFTLSAHGIYIHSAENYPLGRY